MIKKRETFEQIIARKKQEGNHRVLNSNESLVDPEAFKQRMLEVREEYARREWASWLATRDVILR